MPASPAASASVRVTGVPCSLRGPIPDQPVVTYTSNISVYAHTYSHAGQEPRQPIVSIFADDDEGLQTISFRPEFADAMCEAIQTAAKAALAGDRIDPIKFTTDRGTN